MMARRIIGRNAKFFIDGVERELTSFSPPEVAQRPIIPTGDIEISFTFEMDWVNRWKLMAYATPPM
jgi:hypothetical protein